MKNKLICILILPVLYCATPTLRQSIGKNDMAGFDVALAAMPDKSQLNDGSQPGSPPLTYAAVLGNVEMMKKLIAAGADVNIEHKKSHMTPLSTACITGHPAAIKYLLSVGADANYINPKTKQNLAQSVLKLNTVLNNKADVLALLIPNLKKVINQIDSKGVSALHLAAISSDNLAAAELLLKNGANVNIVDTEFGNTPIFAAAAFNQTEMVKFLISKGAKLNAKNKAGETPLKYAELGKASESAEALRKAGAK